MLDRKYGRIVNLVSILAERGMANSAAFASTQAGLLSLTKNLALELGRSNIRVNALGLGWFTTENLSLEATAAGTPRPLHPPPPQGPSQPK